MAVNPLVTISESASFVTAGVVGRRALRDVSSGKRAGSFVEESEMPDRERIRTLDRQRATARRYRLSHGSAEDGPRRLAATMIEMRASHLILRENLRAD